MRFGTFGVALCLWALTASACEDKEGRVALMRSDGMGPGGGGDGAAGDSQSPHNAGSTDAPPSGAADRPTLLSWSADETYLVGHVPNVGRSMASLQAPWRSVLVPSDLAHGAIRATDSTIVYLAATPDGWRIFEHDGTANTDGRTPVPTPGCDKDPLGLLLHPVEGTIFFRCGSGGTWYDEDGVARSGANMTLLAIGYDGSRLLGSKYRPERLVLRGEAEIVVEMPEGESNLVGPVRAGPDGFWVAYTSNDGRVWQWVISYDGSLSVGGEYSYAPLPFESPGILILGESNMRDEEIAPNGDLFKSNWTISAGTDADKDLVVRRRPGGPTSIEYDERKAESGWVYAQDDGFLLSGQ